jgi:hypothetical protein
MSISTNARRIAEIFADRRAKWDAALPRAMRRAVVAVEVRASELLTGAGGTGSYPVPVRTGTLRRALGSRVVGRTEGIVFNTAGYARAIHTGQIATGYKGRGRKQVGPRPFLSDAVERARPGEIIIAEMERAL